MDKGELLAEFKAQLELFDKYQTYIDKARSYADKFNPAVVEKVISDNTAKIQEVANVLDPLIPDMRSVLAELDGGRQAVHQGVEDARMELEELELRQAIGELTDDEFEEATSGLKAKIEGADSEIGDIDAELDDYRSTLERWTSARPDLDEPSLDDGEDLLGDLEDEAGVELDDEDDDDLDDDAFGGGDDDDDLLDDEAFADDGPGDRGVHAQQVSIPDDVSAVFSDDEADDDAGEPIEAAGDDSVGISFNDDEIGDLGDGSFEEDDKGGSDDGGEAVLVLQEGTDEEHAFPIGDGVLSLGRGRDNSIQVKNDSKVSRYHCKLFSRGGNFFIEDNKSANGTLVDGELITEKRLIGGEQVIIGETMFRFRIQA